MSRALLIIFWCYQSVLLGQFPFVPKYTITTTSPASKGYYFLCPIRTDARAAQFQSLHLILDAQGDLVYIKVFNPGISPGNFQLQKNGLITFYKSDRLMHIILDKNCKLRDSITCTKPYTNDGHAFEILDNGHFLTLGIETITMDLSGIQLFGPKKIGGSKQAKVKAGIIQEFDQNKNLVFEWHSIKHFSISDMDEHYLTDTANVDFTHFNALAKDTEGNYLVSARNLNEITKIDHNSGKVIWRLCGKQNQFNFLNDSNKFCAQHDIRVLPNGRISLFDNGHATHPAGGKVYSLNEANREAFLTWQYIENANANSYNGLGNMQVLENGNCLINYGTSNISPKMFTVVDSAKNKIFEIQFNDTLRTYRAFNYLHLPWQLKQPKVVLRKTNGKYFLSADKNYDSYLWSNGSTNKEIEVHENGTYSFLIPFGDAAFIASEKISINEFKPNIH